jgi:formylglycine-generating enzyme required for sulfatase activity
MMKKLISISYFLVVVMGCQKENAIEAEKNPNAPTQLMGYLLGDSAIVLTWIDNSTNEQFFEIEKSVQTGVYSFVKGVEANRTADTLQGVYQVGDSISLRIRAKSSGGYSTYSNSTNVVLSMSEPTNLSAKFVGDSAVILTWLDNTQNERLFEIERKITGGTFVPIKSVSANQSVDTLAGNFLIDDPISFRVRAKSNGGYSAYSNIVSITYVLQPPNNFTTKLLGDSAIVISWNDNSSSERFFEIEQKNPGGNFSLLKTLSSNKTVDTISRQFPQNDEISYRVRAGSNGGYSLYSNTASVTFILLEPSGVKITSISGSMVSISWQDNSGNETSFEILLGIDSSSYSIAKKVSANTIVATIEGITDKMMMYGFSVRATAKYSKSKISNTVLFSPSMVSVNGGTFEMGSNSAVDNAASPVHTVIVGDYFIKTTEVTQAEWRGIVEWKKTHGGSSLNSNPSNFQGDDLPVDQVSWTDIVLWLSYLNEKQGTTRYRLPTEAEWEFAARGGQLSKGYIFSGSNTQNDVSWDSFNASSKTHSVGSKAPNELGLFDMSGNVWEWCSDWFASYSFGAVANPVGPVSGTVRVVRGGSYSHDTGSRVAFRASNPPELRHPTHGFRYVLK